MWVSFLVAWACVVWMVYTLMDGHRVIGSAASEGVFDDVARKVVSWILATFLVLVIFY